jgi:hypothetical protein
MKVSELSLEEASSFGILPEDEGVHPYDPDVEWWNESWFWDFFNADGTVAGHCRIGLHPVQQRVSGSGSSFDRSNPERIQAPASRAVPGRWRYRIARRMGQAPLFVSGQARAPLGPGVGDPSLRQTRA